MQKRINIYIQPLMRERLRLLGRAENRSLSNMLDHIVAEYFKEKQYKTTGKLKV